MCEEGEMHHSSFHCSCRSPEQPRKPPRAWENLTLYRAEEMAFLTMNDTLYFGGPCIEDENKFCQLVE